MAGYGEPSVSFALKTGAQDVGLIGEANPRQYPGHAAIADYEKDCLDIAPSTATANQWVFKTDKNCDFFENLWLYFTTSALTTTGGTYRRLIPSFGLHNFEKIEMRNGTNLVQTIYPSLETWSRYIKSLTYEQREKLWPLVGMGYTAAERNTRATATQTFCVPLDFFWRDDVTKELIVPAVQNGLQITCYLRPLTATVQTDGTVPVLTYTDIQLRQGLVHVPEAQREMNVASVTSGRSIEYIYDELAALPPVIVASGTTTTGQIKLDGLNGPMKHMMIVVRPTASLANAYANDYDDIDWAYNPATLQVKSNGSPIVREYNLRDFLIPITDARCYSGPPCAILFVSFSEMPEDTLTVTGSLNLQEASNPTITFTWAAATTQDYQVDITGFYYNWVQHTDGVLRRIFMP